MGLMLCMFWNSFDNELCVCMSGLCEGQGKRKWEMMAQFIDIREDLEERRGWA